MLWCAHRDLGWGNLQCLCKLQGLQAQLAGFLALQVSLAACRVFNDSYADDMSIALSIEDCVTWGANVVSASLVRMCCCCVGICMFLGDWKIKAD